MEPGSPIRELVRDPTDLESKLEMPNEKKKERKSFTDFQPKTSLSETFDFFKYVPDAQQVSDYLMSTLGRDGPNDNVDGAATRGLTKKKNR